MVPSIVMDQRNIESDIDAYHDLGAMAMKGYFTFPQAPAILEHHRQIV